MTTEQRLGWTMRWSTLFGMHATAAAPRRSTRRCARCRWTSRPACGSGRGATPSRYLTLRGGVELLRSNEPIATDRPIARASSAPIASVGLDQYIARLAVRRRRALRPDRRTAARSELALAVRVRRSRGPSTMPALETERLRLVPITLEMVEGVLDHDRAAAEAALDRSAARRSAAPTRRDVPRRVAERRSDRARVPVLARRDPRRTRRPAVGRLARAAHETPPRVVGSVVFHGRPDRRHRRGRLRHRGRLARPGPRDRGDARVRRVGARAARHRRGAGDDVPVHLASLGVIASSA